jgi:ribosomal RNA-processing protein 17
MAPSSATATPTSSTGKNRKNNNKNTDNRNKKKNDRNNKHNNSKAKLPAKKTKGKVKGGVIKSFIKKGSKREVLFDNESRKQYLRGFSERKKQRRLYGLAMQKVKDRSSKLEERAQLRKEIQEQIEQAEKQKETLLEELLESGQVDKDPAIESEDDDESNNQHDNDTDDDDDDDDQEESEKKPKARPSKAEIVDTKVYNDGTAERTWGGQVIVTTSAIDLDDDDDDDDDIINESTTAATKKKSVDARQKYAGKVERYMNELKSKLPAKHSTTKRLNRKGKNGDGTSKIASKLLNQSKEKQPSKGLAQHQTSGKRGKKRKGR